MNPLTVKQPASASSMSMRTLRKWQQTKQILFFKKNRRRQHVLRSSWPSRRKILKRCWNERRKKPLGECAIQGQNQSTPEKQPDSSTLKKKQTEQRRKHRRKAKPQDVQAETNKGNQKRRKEVNLEIVSSPVINMINTGDGDEMRLRSSSPRTRKQIQRLNLVLLSGSEWNRLSTRWVRIRSSSIIQHSSSIVIISGITTVVIIRSSLNCDVSWVSYRDRTVV